MKSTVAKMRTSLEGFKAAFGHTREETLNIGQWKLLTEKQFYVKIEPK